MGTEIYEIFGKIAGIGGLSLSVFLVLFRGFIKAKFLPDLTNEQAFRLLRLFLILCSLITITGMGLWAYSTKTNVNAINPTPVLKDSLKKDSGFQVYHDDHLDEKILNLQESLDHLMLILSKSKKTYKSVENEYDDIDSKIKTISIRAEALNYKGDRYAILLKMIESLQTTVTLP
jgi:uncharacterized protein YerC